MSAPRGEVHEMFSSANLKKAISPEQNPFHALHSPRDEFSVAARLDVEPHNRFGVRTAQIEAPVAQVEAQAVHFVYGYCFGFKCCLNSRDSGLRIFQREVNFA